jgi:hypothetical protein
MAMDPRAHARFLTYLESFEYFGRTEQSKLSREDWTEHDAELEQLLVEQSRRALQGVERARIEQLRRVLFRD